MTDDGQAQRTDHAPAGHPLGSPATGNRYDRMEWAGAFGDLGTLIPFVVGYIGVLGMDPGAVLLPLGLAMVACGVYYRTPFPVQPMKAIAAIAITQSAQTAVITPSVVVGAALATGVIWLLLGLTGAAGRLAGCVPKAVTSGIVLGLGLGFVVDGLGMMASHWPIAAVGLGLTLALLRSRRLPAMFVLLMFGAICGAVLDPAAMQALLSGAIEAEAPRFALAAIGWNDLVVGTLFLALPQLPLTLGNAVIAIRDENNRLFPDRPVSERGVAISTGLINLAGATIGGIPMCHGAGGMAGHVAFGARSGGALVIVGTILTVLAVLFGGSVEALFRLFPAAILGVILAITGGQLVLASRVVERRGAELVVALATAAVASWNVGAAFVVGLIASALLRVLARRDGDPSVH
ncbi:MAG: putative sulfate/molybdate transporter [Rhodocyclaceae bacterium]|nr:putative sulfate/molybdate transporter [Rhodocyclaceae bacterium]